MLMRRRFKMSRVCSSENYKESKKYFLDYMARRYNVQISTVIEMLRIEAKRGSVHKVAYVLCFGNYVRVDAAEATRRGVKVVWR